MTIRKTHHERISDGAGAETVVAKKKGKKIRVAFKKNRQKKVRKNKLSSHQVDEHVDSQYMDASERLTGKGDLTRHRTVMGVEQETEDGTEIVIDIDESNCLPGRVIRAQGLNSVVQTADGNRYECTVRRLVRTMSRDDRNAVVAGDHVLIRPEGDEYQAVIERVEPRRSYLSRGSKRREHILVSNIDQAVIVVSADDPPLKPSLIDRFLISSEKGNIHSIICINKIDLVDPIELQPQIGVYAQLGYDIVLTSVVAGTGIPRLRSLLKGKQSVFSGQSGVGKSSLLNQIDSRLSLETAEISQENRKGKHTTRSAVLLEIATGGWVVDTPGIRQLQLWDVSPEEVEGFFREFHAFVPQCRFPDCSHTHEDNCGIKRAVHNDFISRQRYQSYLKIIAGDDPRPVYHQ
ncbi:ribosome small subunit-dependent GTPase A [Gimesia sp.]|uniref:ribosome small subunit-dependent GTPase A n=1 Tax=Gimesia sp. TaxID=2024833 RepID=UPI0032EAAC5D